MKEDDTQIKQEEIANKLGDPLWRIENLYYIKDKSGKRVKFKLNDEQRYLMDNYWFFNIVPKARQLGITTFFCIFYLDAILFSANKTAGIIAHTREASKKIFKEKIKFAWDNLEPWVKEQIGEPSTDTVQEMTFPNGSTIFVSTSARSGTIQYLHISEFGFTCQHYPEKAEEIVTGSINTVEAGQGMVSIESTAEGRGGYFYDFCMEAQESQLINKRLSEIEFKLFFFPWWNHPSYRLKNADIVITEEDKGYFSELKTKHSIDLDIGQKAWYVSKKKLNKDKMLKEYPSVMEEAFNQAIEGAYYKPQMNKVYEEKRIGKVPYVEGVPVDTHWDLGVNDFNVIIFTQRDGNAINIIDVYHNSGEGLAHYVNYLRDKPYVYGEHVFPHDLDHRDVSTGITRKQYLYDLGMTNIRVVPKSGIQEGIEKVRSLFSRLYFDEVKGHNLVTALSAYRKQWDFNNGVFKDKPKHDDNSHFADAVRTMAVGWQDGYSTSELPENYAEESNFFNLT